jgi:hypothetical protein
LAPQQTKTKGTNMRDATLRRIAQSADMWHKKVDPNGVIFSSEELADMSFNDRYKFLIENNFLEFEE